MLYTCNNLVVMMCKMHFSLSICLSISLSFCLSVCLYVNVSVCLSERMYVYIFVYLYVCLSIYICLSVCMYVCPYICMSICKSVCLSICLCVPITLFRQGPDLLRLDKLHTLYCFETGKELETEARARTERGRCCGLDEDIFEVLPTEEQMNLVTIVGGVDLTGMYQPIIIIIIIIIITIIIIIIIIIYGYLQCPHTLIPGTLLTI